MRILSSVVSLSLLSLAVACDGTSGMTEPEPSGELPYECEDTFCVLSGEVLEDVTLTNDVDWLLRGGVFIGDDDNEVTLTVEPGTQIFGETSTRGMLVVRRGSKLMAEGTSDAPIVFTSSQEPGSRARGDWGGVVLNGRAPVNGCDTGVCESIGEGDTGVYGGDDEDDNSGVMKYVRIEYAGALISPDNELNGLGFQGVGRATTIDYVQVHMAKDDCVEFFGGTAEAKHILCTGTADDNLDWTDGWRGKLQFFIAQQYDDAGDNGIEADNNGEDNNSSPRSYPTLSNLTLIGVPGSDTSDIGALLREGTAAQINNMVVQGFGESCLDIDHDATFTQAENGDLTIQNSIFDCVTPFGTDAEDPMDVGDFVMTTNEGNLNTDPVLKNAFATGMDRDFAPSSGSPAATGASMPSGGFFDTVDYIGAMDPDADWTAGWTTADRN